MSSQRGNVTRTRAQKNQNRDAFKHNPKSKLSEKIKELPNVGLCGKCHEIVEWRKKYRRYKPLTQPKKCDKCHLKKVKHAYHLVCEDCVLSLLICAKCMEVKPLVSTDYSTPEDRARQQAEKDLELKFMKERERRRVMRQKLKDSEDRKQRRRDAGKDSDGESTEEEEDGMDEVTGGAGDPADDDEDLEDLLSD
eukprot:GFYU01017338.1.p1 GENE.GFYU01017338.1~~GFYU01017338.1.p1  ORF type:complete len:194 (+),score=45.12 GFYU01017338.1:139-720(+)